MTLPAARIADMHVCPLFTGFIPHIGGPIVTACPTVLIGKLPAATAGSMAVCIGPPDVVAKGSTTVLTCKKPQARMGDTCAHGGAVAKGCFTALVGG
ncbi:MAG: PAAR domain-containing protein [Pseudomonadota bacterium]|nr:PAAR domain-containing protein [Pseudomonadota bacterium]